MQIKYRGGNEFEIKSKDLEVNLSSRVLINGFLFPGPGEYEKGGVILNGIADEANTIYVANFEELTLCHLGNLGHDLSEDEVKQIGSVDILFLPLGQNGSTELKIALKVLNKIDPKMVIPMLFDEASVSEFRKSEGYTEEALELLKIRKVDLPDDVDCKVVVLK
jgi:L-ascorbate metabolism protein UlaG (beta-lactamase superfamily)